MVEVAKCTKAMYIGGINVRTNVDKLASNITGLVVLSANSLIAVDRTRHSTGNNSIKHIDALKGNIVSVLDTASCAFDVTAVSNDQFAATFSTEGRVRFVSVTKTGKLKMKRGFNAGENCHGICLVEDKLFVSYEGPRGQIKVFDLHGAFVKEISVDKDGNSIFSNPFYISFSEADGTVLVTDFDKRQLISLSQDGNVISVIQDRRFRVIAGVTSDTDGSVFVCIPSPASVMEVSQNDITVLSERNGDLVYPQSIAYCKATQHLYVGMWGEDNIAVYQLSKEA